MSESRGLILEWHSFNVSLAEIRTWVAANLTDMEISLEATPERLYTKLYGPDNAMPSQADKDALLAWWNALTDSDDAATNYYSFQQLKDAIDAARNSAIGKNWDDMTTAEQKIVAGLQPTPEELGLV